MRSAVLITLTALLALALSGCASFKANVKSDADLSKYSRVWVKSNLNDNRGIGQFICNALQARGIESGVGPLTMMPFNMQAVISYNDSWTWDFKDHMTGLELQFRDNKIDFPIASADYVGPTSFTKHPNEVVEKLVAKLFTVSPDKKK